MIGRDGINVRVKFNDLPRIKRSMLQTIVSQIAKAAHDIAANAIAAVPVLTGYLKNSIQAFARSAAHWIVRVGAEYGVYVEMGTRYMRAQPFLIPAYERVIPQLIASLRVGLARP